MKTSHITDQLEILLLLVGARGASEIWSIDRLLFGTRRLAALAQQYPVGREHAVDDWQRIAARAVGRVSRLIPGVRCLHRALACRVWFARRGVRSEVVVGFRKRGAIEGHAWLEIHAPDGPLLMFHSEEDGYKESFREHARTG